jgi:hypothetical protein
MHLSLIPADEAALISKPSFEFGTCSKILDLHAKSAPEMLNNRSYGCCHCFHSAAVGKSSNADADSGTNTIQVSRPEGVKLLNFNGLRSHLKTK